MVDREIESESLMVDLTAGLSVDSSAARATTKVDHSVVLSAVGSVAPWARKVSSSVDSSAALTAASTVDQWVSSSVEYLVAVLVVSSAVPKVVLSDDLSVVSLAVDWVALSDGQYLNYSCPHFSKSTSANDSQTRKFSRDEKCY